MTELRLVTNEEGSCPGLGISPTGDDGVPCDLQKDHKGKHEFQLPMSFQVYGWTDKNRKMKRI